MRCFSTTADAFVCVVSVPLLTPLSVRCFSTTADAFVCVVSVPRAGAVRLQAAGAGGAGVPAGRHHHRDGPLRPALVERRDRGPQGTLPKHLRHHLPHVGGPACLSVCLSLPPAGDVVTHSDRAEHTQTHIHATHTPMDRQTGTAPLSAAAGAARTRGISPTEMLREYWMFRKAFARDVVDFHRVRTPTVADVVMLCRWVLRVLSWELRVLSWELRVLSWELRVLSWELRVLFWLPWRHLLE